MAGGRAALAADLAVARVEPAWRVYDFSIEGVSLVNNYRESFSRFLVNHRFEELMERLERKRPRPAGAAM